MRQFPSFPVPHGGNPAGAPEALICWKTYKLEWWHGAPLSCRSGYDPIADVHTIPVTAEERTFDKVIGNGGN